MTRRGPVPIELPHADMDYEHYENKQLRPVVEDMLAMKGKSLAEILSGEEQLRLFEKHRRISNEGIMNHEGKRDARSSLHDSLFDILRFASPF